MRWGTVGDHTKRAGSRSAPGEGPGAGEGVGVPNEGVRGVQEAAEGSMIHGAERVRLGASAPI